MEKYLYGKKAILRRLIEGDVGFRFSELAYYASMENGNMRDYEMYKTFVVDKNLSSIHINNIPVPSEAMTQDPVLEVPTQYCYCLCLSHRKDSSELYEKFKADVCVEVKADALVECLIEFFKQHKNLKGVKVMARSVTYYRVGGWPITTDPVDLVFHKHERFAHESEFRIALFFPTDKPGFKAETGEFFPFRNDDDPQHISLSNPDREFTKQFIGEVYTP